MALKAQGIKIKRGDGASSESFVTIADIVGFQGPDGEASEIDVTTLDSTRKEFLMGLPDEGRITLTLLYDPNDTTHAALLTDRNNQTLRNFKLDYNTSPAKVDSFAAYVLSCTRGVETDGRMEGTATLRITGVITTGSS